MYVRPLDRKRLKTLSRSKTYRDTFLSTHVRAGIAYQIQALREKLGLSQQAFARKIGVTQSVVARLENPDYGKVTVQTLLNVAIALDVALQIRFCSYPQFLEAINDLSPQSLAAEEIYVSVKRVDGQLSTSPQPTTSEDRTLMHDLIGSRCGLHTRAATTRLLTMTFTTIAVPAGTIVVQLHGGRSQAAAA